MRTVCRGGKAESLAWVSESEHGEKCTFKGMAQDITAEASEVTEDSQHREQSLSRVQRVFMQGQPALAVRTQTVRRMSI